MIILQATPDLVDPIYDILNSCRTAMNNEGIHQWLASYPTIDTVSEDIQRGELYVLQHNNKCYGTITLNEQQDEAYQTVNWKNNNGKIAVIHRLAVHPHYQQHGYARELMDFAEHHAAINGYSSIRLDSYTGNPRAIRFYENRGYAKRGEVYFPGRVLIFYCYEKELKF